MLCCEKSWPFTQNCNVVVKKVKITVIKMVLPFFPTPRNRTHKPYVCELYRVMLFG